MRFMVSIILSVILAAVPLGAAASPSSASIAMEASMAHAAHGAAAVIMEAPTPACPDAGCPAEHHDTACATQAAHCKSSADRGGASLAMFRRFEADIRYGFAHDAGVGVHLDLQLPPPRP
jgi:hypothetical protein